MKPRYFKTPADFRAWLDTHHADTPELWVGFYKKASGKGGISYQDGVDAALCYGWIDGIKKRVDEDGYTHRFSPRTAKSVWSAINTRRAGELKRLGLMQPPGLEAFEKRDPARSGLYSFENPERSLSPPLQRELEANKKAWSFFEAQPPGYRRVAVFWIMSAKQEETQRRRLAQLIQASERKLRFGALTGQART